VIPRWLIELTGYSKRNAMFGPILDGKTKRYSMKEFAFERFAFPACESCNAEFSKVEKALKPVFCSFLNGAAISCTQFALLLGWLDKVRVGLWLSMLYLQKGFYEITPHFYINTRVDMSDRMLLIYRSDFLGKRLTVWGSNLLSFHYTPSCFALVVNNCYFLNASFDFLVSKGFGLPYPRRMFYVLDPVSGNYLGATDDLLRGAECVSEPIVGLDYDPRCAQLFQPMFSKPNLRSLFSSLYETDYVRSVSIDHVKGIGRVFYYDDTVRMVQTYPPEESRCWIPSYIWADDLARKVVFSQTLRFQNRLSDYGPCDHKTSLKEVKGKFRRVMRKRLLLSRNLNDILLQRIIREI
jgi:hypothetical protein